MACLQTYPESFKMSPYPANSSHLSALEPVLSESANFGKLTALLLICSGGHVQNEYNSGVCKLPAVS